MDYEKKSSGVAKAGLATGITGTALGVLDIIKDQWGCKDGRRGGHDGGYGYGGGYPYPGAYPAYPGVPYAPAAPGCGCYVTEKEMCLIRENADKGDVIAAFQAKEYTDNKIDCAVAPLRGQIGRLQDEVCELQKCIAVNNAHDMDFRKYVEREFIHQPKAGIRESLVVCHQCGCECDERGRRGRDERRGLRDCDCDCDGNGGY